MHTLELFFRFAGVSQLLLVAIVLIKDHRDKPSGLIAAVWALSVACYLIIAPAYRDWHWESSALPFLIGAICGPVLLWLLARSLFDDHFRFRRHHLLIVLAVVGVTLVSISLYDTESNSRAVNLLAALIPQLLTLTFVFLALVVTLKDWRADLVESRRRVRVVLVVVAGGHSVVIAVVTILLAGGPNLVDVAPLDLINAGVIFLLSLAFNSVLLSMHPGFLVGKTPRLPASELPAEDITPVITELQRLMVDQQLYCEHGLTIRQLAERLGQQEYKLRRIINGHYGYRNFNDFLNRYRIEEATKRLIVTKTRRLPVLTIAMDVGYRSLAPFNKAFKEIHGTTPTEYRRAKASLDASSPSSDTT